MAQVNQELKEEQQTFAQILKGCDSQWQSFKKTVNDETAAQLHTCFMPLVCKNYTKRVLNCVNKNHTELHGCESEINEMLKCSIDKFHRYFWKAINFEKE